MIPFQLLETFLIFHSEQSAGKSRLIGALTGIDLPSGPGTCTRVPVQIKTRDDGAAWSCNIVLGYSHSHDRTPSASFKGAHIGPWWEDAKPTMVDFMTITSKSDLQEAMKAAQMALLNPKYNPQEYVPHSGSRWRNPGMQESFSPNLIVLDISEPGQQNLSLIDLPGIIQIADTKDLVRLVSSMVQHFIKRENALLLCCLPMSGDPSNSAAIRYVKEANATHRCLGVITKPDLMRENELDSVWLPLLRNETVGAQLEHNYWVTKQPGQSAYGGLTNHEQARRDEEEYFSSSIWTGKLQEFQDRCGTKKLREALGKKLASLIKLE